MWEGVASSEGAEGATELSNAGTEVNAERSGVVPVSVVRDHVDDDGDVEDGVGAGVVGEALSLFALADDGFVLLSLVAVGAAAATTGVGAAACVCAAAGAALLLM